MSERNEPKVDMSKINRYKYDQLVNHGEIVMYGVLVIYMAMLIGGLKLASLRIEQF